MDEMMGKLQEVLSDPESMAQIQQLAQMFGLGNSTESTPVATPAATPVPAPVSNPTPDMGGLMSMMQNMLSSTPKNNPTPAPVSAPSAGLGNIASLLGGGGGSGGLPFDMNFIMQLGQVMQSAQCDDKDTALLVALKPHLSEERQPRVDKAIKLMKMVSIFTAAKNSGLLSKLAI